MSPFDSLDEFDTLESPHDHGIVGRLESIPAIVKFCLAGHAVFTIKSKATGVRFTYRIGLSKASEKFPVPMHFVSVLTGSDNENSYTYMGQIRRGVFIHGRKASISVGAPSAKAFDWFWRMVSKGKLSEQLEIWHEGRCGRCARTLTVPESIESGFGPECITKLT